MWEGSIACMYLMDEHHIWGKWIRVMQRLTCIYSPLITSPEQSSRRAIVLPPASALALAFALASASTNVKVLR